MVNYSAGFFVGSVLGFLAESFFPFEKYFPVFKTKSLEDMTESVIIGVGAVTAPLIRRSRENGIDNRWEKWFVLVPDISQGKLRETAWGF